MQKSDLLVIYIYQLMSDLRKGKSSTISETDVFILLEMSEQWCPEGEVTTSNGAPATVAWGLKASNNPVTVGVMSKMGGYSGPKTISKLLKGMNINLRKEDEVPSMCLGIMDLSPFQMVGAQAMFVNQGMFIQPSYILRIEDRNGNIIFTNEPEGKRRQGDQQNCRQKPSDHPVTQTTTVFNPTFCRIQCFKQLIQGSF